MEAVYREQIKKCIAALEDDDSEELEFLKDETLGIAIALSDRPPEKEPTTRELFDEVDDDGSGYLDRLEVATLCSNLGSTLPAHVLNEAMAQMDKDGNDKVSYEEFDAWWSDKTATERRQRQFRDAFDVVDQRGKGSLPKAGLQRVLQRVGDGLSPRELQNAFSEIQGLQKELIRDDVRKAFDLADLAGEGKIPKAKVAAVAEHLNASNIVAENALEMGSGTDGQERISFDVVAAWWDDQWEKERKRKQVHEAFERVDEDGSGSLDFHVSSVSALVPILALTTVRARRRSSSFSRGWETKSAGQQQRWHLMKCPRSVAISELGAWPTPFRRLAKGSLSTNDKRTQQSRASGNASEERNLTVLLSRCRRMRLVWSQNQHLLSGTSRSSLGSSRTTASFVKYFTV